MLKDHNAVTPVRLKPAASRSRVKHSTTEPLRSQIEHGNLFFTQWLSGRVLDSRPKGRGFEPHRRHCVVSLSKNINPSLVLVQPRKTRPFITERLLMGHKESNKQTNTFWSRNKIINVHFRNLEVCGLITVWPSSRENLSSGQS